MPQSYYVYVLFSEKHRRYYTGSSSDPAKRLKGHNDPRSKGWTSRYRPWRIIHIEKLRSKHAALEREKWFKGGVGRAYIKTIHQFR